MKKSLSILIAPLFIAACANPLPPGYHYEPGSFTPTKNQDDGLTWCKQAGIEDRVTQPECDAALAKIYNSPEAVEAQKKQMFCLTEGSVYQAAASYRDSGLPPQKAFFLLKSYTQHGLQEDFIKTAINQVYFDDRFVDAGGNALASQMANICLFPKGRFSPVK